MPHKPTGRPTGRPRGSGTLGLSEHEPHTRLTIRIPEELYTRLVAFAEGRSYTRGTPQLAGCVRALLEHALACPYKRQTGSVPAESEEPWQTGSDATPARGGIRQTENRSTPGRAETWQTGNILPEGPETEDLTARPRTSVAREGPRACGHGATRWNLKRRVCLDCDAAAAKARREAKRQAKQAAPVT